MDATRIGSLARTTPAPVLSNEGAPGAGQYSSEQFAEVRLIRHRDNNERN